MKNVKHSHIGPWLAGLLFLTALSVALWVHEDKLGSFLRNGTDSLGYYQWLPSILLEGRLDAMPWVHVLENGNGLSLFNIGVALMLLPFFLAGHCWALAAGIETDGYSSPYCVAQFAAAAFYLALGSLLAYRVLRRYHSQRTALWATGLLYLGTNLFYYASFEPGMSHVYSFFLFALLLWLTEKWIERPRAFLLPGMAVALMLIVLVRPLNGIAVLIPALYRTHGPRDALARWRPVVRMRPGILVAAGMALLLLFPQLLYWHAMTGHWIVFTYGTKGESFDFSAPHLLDIIVSHQNGWFLYTPMMLPVMASLVLLSRRSGTGARTILAIWALAWYLYGSWWAWWLGAAFGYRGFVDYFALLALPLAAIVARALSFKTFWRKVAVGMAVFLVFLNIRLSVTYTSPWDGPDWTWASYERALERALFLE
jgi:hypothetical protein